MSYEDIYLMKVYKITNTFIHLIHFIFCMHMYPQLFSTTYIKNLYNWYKVTKTSY